MSAVAPADVLDAPLADLATLTEQVSRDGILLPYQKRYLEEARGTQLMVAEKSRRIGITWTEAADDVVHAATARSDGGDDVSYIGYNLEMAREFIDACADWARHFNKAHGEIQEFLFDDAKPGEEDRHIKAFRIDFGSGNKIIALSSKPRSLRGRKGRVVIDEAAFHDELEELVKAALALLVWGGQVRIISTHDGADNAFNELINEIRAGKRDGAVYRCTFDEAVADGLYERVCLRKKEEPTLEGKAEWIRGVRGAYGDAAKEELDVIPARSSGAWLSLALLEKQSVDVPVVRYTCKPDFVHESPEVRKRVTELWCRENLLPLLQRLDRRRRHALGQDFARYVDLSVIWPVEVGRTMVRNTPFLVEMSCVPYEQQRQILFFICDRLPRFFMAALDAGGNGGYLAEVAQQRYGEPRVQAVKFTVEWYREHTPKLKAAFEDGEFFIPRDDDVIADFREFKVVQGVARLPARRTTSKDGQKRHGDAAIAGLLGHWATTVEAVVIEHGTTGDVRGLDGGELEKVSVGFGAVASRNEMEGFGL